MVGVGVEARRGPSPTLEPTLSMEGRAVETSRKPRRVPKNIVYNVDGASYGLDNGLVEAIQTSIRSRLQQGTFVMPRLPQAAVRILQLSEDADVDLSDVTEVVSTDPGLAARLLSIANSAAYAGSAQVQGLGPALSRLGMKTVSNLVFAESIQSKVFSVREYRSLLEQSWQVSLGAAVACEHLSRATGLESEGAFLIGLLHDVGVPALVNAVNELSRQNLGRPLEEEVVEILISQLHEETGAHVLREWGMPAAAIAAAGNHHLYRNHPDTPPACRLIHAAVLVGQHLGIGGEPREIHFTIEHAFRDLGLNDTARMEPIVEAVSVQIAGLMSGFAANGSH